MIRDLATLITDLRDGLETTVDEARRGIRVQRAEMSVPIDVSLLFRDGSCVLQADVARNYADAHWLQGSSQLRLVWERVPTDVFTGGIDA